MDKFDIIMTEIRELRADIKKLNDSVWTLKTRFAVVALTLGAAGGKISSLLPFLK